MNDASFMISPLIDTHCHLSHDRFATDREAVINAMQAAGLVQAICIATGNDDAEKVWAIHEQWPDYIQVAAGLDPFSSFDAGDRFADEFAKLETFLRSHACVGLGEIGLDYHYDLNTPAIQQTQLHQQLALAEKLELPVVIHVREAHADMQHVLAEHPQVRGVIHSFTAGPAEAARYLELGWYLSFNGVATFKNAPEVREAARMTPADRIVVETDSPYLAPVPKRGKRCEPAFVSHTVALLADERGERPEDLANWSTRNACALFQFEKRLDPAPVWTTLH